MEGKPEDKFKLAPLLGSMLTSLIVTVGGLVVEYKSGFFQKVDVSQADNKNVSLPATPTPQPPFNTRPNFPGTVVRPPTTPSVAAQEVDIDTLYTYFRHDSMKGNAKFGNGSVLEVTADVGPKYGVPANHQPFVLMLESGSLKLPCEFNNPDELKGIDEWNRVTVRGQLQAFFQPQFTAPIPNSSVLSHLELTNCTLVHRDWKLSIYLKAGLAAFIIFSVLIYAIWQKVKVFRR